MKTSKKLVTLPRGTICPVCHGEGVVWAEKSLECWRVLHPEYDGKVPAPPDLWRDQNCERCQGAGHLDPKTGEPLWDRLIPSAVPRDVRLRRQQSRGRRVRQGR